MTVDTDETRRMLNANRCLLKGVKTEVDTDVPKFYGSSFLVALTRPTRTTSAFVSDFLVTFATMELRGNCFRGI